MGREGYFPGTVLRISSSEPSFPHEGGRDISWKCTLIRTCVGVLIFPGTTHNAYLGPFYSLNFQLPSDSAGGIFPTRIAYGMVFFQYPASVLMQAVIRNVVNNHDL